MSHCETARQRMSGVLDSGLDPEDARALKAHLRACPRCQATWAALQEVERILSARPMVPVPAGFAERTLACLEARGVAAARGQSRENRLWPAAGVALVALSLLLWWAILLGLPAALSLAFPAAWSGLRLFWEALATLGRSLAYLLGLLVPFCRGLALAASVLALAFSLAVMGSGLRKARLRV
ncbi:MAG: anti-sigma factor family protein [Anaerolineae bacterium]